MPARAPEAGSLPVARRRNGGSRALEPGEGDDARRVERKRRGAQAAREGILEAAATVFARKGYYGATIDDVATQAGYSPAALYKHFAGRDDLFGQLWNDVAQRIDDIFSEAVALRGPFELKLHWLLERLSKGLETTPELYVSFMAHRPYIARQRQSEMEKVAYRHYRHHVTLLSELMQTGIDEGVLRPADPEDLALSFIGLLYEFAYRWVTSGTRSSPSAVADRLIDLFLHGAGAATRKTRKEGP